MANSQTPSSTDEEQWLVHRTTITTLYLEQNRTLSDVRAIMSRDYGFSVTEAQLERRFKLWNLKKNRTKQDWQVITTKVKKRKREGKESDVYSYGKIIPQKRIRQEMSRSRCMIDATTDDMVSLSTPPTPDGIQISTPSNHLVQSFPIELPSHRLIHNLLDQAVHTSTNGPRQLLERFTETCRMLNDDHEASVSIRRIDTRLLASETLHHPNAVPDNERALAFSSYALSYVCALLFYMSNNLLGLAEEANHIDRLLKMIKPAGLGRFLTTILCRGSPSAEAISDRLFQYSVPRKNIEVMRIALCLGTDPNQPLYTVTVFSKTDYEIWLTPLAYAIVCKKLAMVSFLIEHGANIEGVVGLRFKYNRTPLTLAVSIGQSHIVRFLIECGVNLNHVDGDTERSALHYARFDLETIQLLLEAGADAHRLDRHGHNCLQTAFIDHDRYLWMNDEDCERTKKVVDIYLDKGLDINNCCRSGHSVLNLAVKTDHLWLIKFLISRGSKVTSETMHYAVSSGSLPIVQFLQSIGVSLHSIVLGRDLLAKTILRSKFELAKLLITKCALADPKLTYDDGCGDDFEVGLDDGRLKRLTPVHAACAVDRLDLVCDLVNRGASVNAPPSYNSYDMGNATALSTAVRNGNLDMVNTLLEAGAGIESISNIELNFNGALVLGIEQGNINIVKRLLDAGLGTCKDGSLEMLALSVAIRAGNEELVTLFRTSDLYLDPQITAQSKYHTPIVEAILKGYFDLAAELLEAGVNINNHSAKLHGITALEAAVKVRNIQLIDRLIASGADADDPYALREAIRYRPSFEIVTLLSVAHLHQHGKLKSKFGTLAIRHAVNDNKINVVHHFIEWGFDFNDNPSTVYQKGYERLGKDYGRLRKDYGQFRKDYGRLRDTALQIAVRRKSTEVIELLLDAGADPKSPAIGKFQRTALQLAVEGGTVPILKRLLAAGCDVNEYPASSGGVTALQAAAIKGHVGIARILIALGADVNALGAKKDGRTALEGAAEYGRIDMLQLLLDSGAELHGLGQSQYERASLLAKNGGHLAAARMLKTHYQSTLPDQTTSNTCYDRSQIEQVPATSSTTSHEAQEQTQPEIDTANLSQPMSNLLHDIEFLILDKIRRCFESE